jgi:hypothetical protein
MQVNRTDTVMVCRICERTLLLGERATYYRADVQEMPVCPLCADEADARGWLRAGAPSPPPVESVAVRGPGLMTRMLDSLRRSGPEPESLDLSPRPDEPEDENLGGAAWDGVAMFNRSPYRRTVSGISKSLGEPQVSVVPLPGTRPDVVVTVAWDISWYQYRVDASGGAIRLEGRGDDPGDLDERWCRWNARAVEDGRLAIA